MKNILKKLWQYWKWVCVTLLTTYAALILITGLVMGWKHMKPTDHQKKVQECIETGGRWNADTNSCENAA